MLNNASGFEKIYICCGYSDLRRGIDGFASMIQQKFKIDPFNTGILFLFCGRKTDRIKGLLWEGDGFLLLYKRLETGKFQWPRNEDEVKAISPQQYKWLMEGLSIDQKKLLNLPLLKNFIADLSTIKALFTRIFHNWKMLILISLRIFFRGLKNFQLSVEKQNRYFLSRHEWRLY